MAIFKYITPAAVEKIKSLAQFEGIPLDQLYVQIDDKPVGPWQMFWIITLATSFDASKYYLEQLGGLNIAVEQPGSVFLVGATIDFDHRVINKPFYPQIAVFTPRDRPVLPKGFLLRNQVIYPQYQFV